ncbi:MAG: hypothetical protein JRN15_19120 [Nitrososphaerota archaeon]|nr:hypothetical protein [Nitrososphaerota archaeon]
MFCTSFFDIGSEAYSSRWNRWLDYYMPRMRCLGADRIFIIDDGSSPGNINLNVSIVDADRALPANIPEGVVVFRFQEHLGRQSVFCFPGWWRSFTYCCQIAKAYSFCKIIHIESDAFVLTGRMASYISSLSDGWTALWCPRYKRPETAIQVICSDSLSILEKYYHAGIALWSKRVCAELVLPFSRVESHFIGDRYGEYTSIIPDGADFSAQTTLHMSLPRQLKAQARGEEGVAGDAQPLGT